LKPNLGGKKKKPSEKGSRTNRQQTPIHTWGKKVKAGPDDERCKVGVKFCRTGTPVMVEANRAGAWKPATPKRQKVVTERKKTKAKQERAYLLNSQRGRPAIATILIHMVQKHAEAGENFTTAEQGFRKVGEKIQGESGSELKNV